MITTSVVAKLKADLAFQYGHSYVCSELFLITMLNSSINTRKSHEVFALVA